jgi:ZIP family zinc transporter/zinc and cadmium transporter
MLNRSALVYTAIAASANLLGAAAVVSRSRWSVRALETMVALSAGFMVSVALLDLAPDAIRTHGESAALVILIGYLLVHLTQHTLAPHFHFGEEVHPVTKVVSFSALAGLMLHTFVDGVAIASGFGVSEALGLLVFFAILLHKLPEGLAISSLFLASGESRRAALAASGGLAVSSMVGALLTQEVPVLARYGLPLAAGVTLYVGASNLVPEFQGKSGWRLPISFFSGCLLYYLARRLIGAA